MAKEKFDMEQAARDACAQFDREHGDECNSETTQMSGPPVYDSEGFSLCPCGCGAKTHKDVIEKRKKEIEKDMMDAKLLATVETVPGTDQAGVVVRLPETKEQAYILMLGIVNTMSIAGGETFDEIMSEINRLKNMGAMSKGIEFSRK